MIPALDTMMEPVIFDLNEPYGFEFQGSKFVYDPTIKIAQKCNELGLNGVKVTRITVSEWTSVTAGESRANKIRVVLEGEAAR